MSAGRQAQQAQEDRRRAFLEAQAQALQAGRPELAPRSPEEIGDREIPRIEQLRRRAVQTVAERQLEALKLQMAARSAAQECLDRGEGVEGYRLLRSHLEALEQTDPEKALLESLGYAHNLLERLGATLTPQQSPAAAKLIWLSLEVALREPYTVSGRYRQYVTFHARGYELQMALFPHLYDGSLSGQDAAEQALRRTLNALQEAGILTRRRHIGNARDRETGRKLPWADGTVFKFNLRPGGRAPRLSYYELSQQYADLERETRKHWTLRRTGKAALLRVRAARGMEPQRTLSVTKDNSPNGECATLKQLLQVVVNVVQASGGVRFFVSDKPVLEQMLQTVGRVKGAPLEAKAAWVAEGARRLARLISDETSVGHWAMVLWRGLQATLMGQDLLGLLAAGCRAMFEAQQRFYIRAPGGWLRTWLRRNGGAELVAKMPGQYPVQLECNRLSA